MQLRSSPNTSRPTVGATPGHVLELVRSRPAWTRQQLLTATGMSRPTLQDRLAPLFASGLIYSAGFEASEGGRPAELIRFDDRHLVILTLDVGHTHARVGISTVRGQVLRFRDSRLDVTRTPPPAVLNTLIGLAAELTVDAPDERVAGIGIGLPGPISLVTGLPGQTTTLPGWEHLPIFDLLRERWNVPMVTENDARALALGEATRHPESTVLGLKWAHGIGAGLIINNRSLGGDDGAAGDIGHVKLSRGGPECRCGRRGCLAAYASGHALLARLAPVGVRDLDHLAELANAGDRKVRAALDGAARRVGTVLAALIALANPRTLVLGGTIGTLPRVVDAVAARVREVTLSRSVESLQVLPSQLGPSAGTAGLVHLVVERVLSAEAVDRSLAAEPGSPHAAIIRAPEKP
ncbi:ROK family protein [Micromonospora sp. SL1-18]|uniref:ROK family protein n=1 Tax=Micromonospora sp. SL1-18 TaxID=3399128 RepID=UPI003A4DDD22